MASVTAGSAVKYVLFPGILPRLKQLFFNGFSLLAYYVAIIYGMGKLLPASHPYLQESNIGKYGIRHAVFAAWHGLDFKWKNIDRIIFFFAVISGLILMTTYLLGAFFFLVTAPAMAMDIQIGQLFGNPNPHDDIAFMMLDRLLGIPGIYDSKVITDQAFGPAPNAFHAGLMALFAYYSWTLFGIAVLIFLYFIAEIVVETTMTGTPFGKHFENIWVPIRLVAGLGLLMPIPYLNSAQMMTLYIAKIGSNFATNAWIAYNSAMENPMGLENKEIMATPVTPDFTGLAKDLFTIRACVDITLDYGIKHYQDAVAKDSGVNRATFMSKYQVEPYFVDGKNAFDVLGGLPTGRLWPDDYSANFINMYLEGLRFYKGKDIRVVFGIYKEELIDKYPGGIEPTCGEVLIPNTVAAGVDVPAGDITNPEISEALLIGATHLFNILKMTYSVSQDGFAQNAGGDEERLYDMLLLATERLFFIDTSVGRKQAEDYYKTPCPNDTNDDKTDDLPVDGSSVEFPEMGVCTGPISNEFYLKMIQEFQRFFSYGPLMGYDYYTGLAQDKLDKRAANIDCSQVVSGAQARCDRLKNSADDAAGGYATYLQPYSSVYYEDLGQDNPLYVNRTVSSDLFKYGWGGAGIWYNIISEKNGLLMGATNALPRVTHFPQLMEMIGAERATSDQTVSLGGCERYNPAKAGDTKQEVGGNKEDASSLAKVYYNLCTNLNLNEHMKLADTPSTVQKTGNPAIDVINALFGTKGLFDFRENSGVNPMAQMAALGRALIDKAVQNIMIGVGGSAVGGLLTLVGSTLGNDAGSAGAMALAGGTIASALSGLMVTMATTGLVAGVLLYYVIPMMPFMYFFFAVGTWVKTIFEALVGVPLWALAHVRIEGGPGFAGKAAQGGYFLLLEIFIRPIVTLFALVASMFIFMALAYMLNTTWGLVTGNLVGFDPYTQSSTDPLKTTFYRPKIDQFFFTLTYIIFMYMTATGVFKLIDQIPDGIMRWISDVKAWGVNDSADEMVGDVSRNTAFTMEQYVGPLTQSSANLAGAAAKSPGVVNDFKDLSARMANTGKSGGEPK